MLDINATRRCPHGNLFDDYCGPCEQADQEENRREDSIMSEPTRYLARQDGMLSHKDGTWVRLSDYAELQAENERQRKLISSQGIRDMEKFDEIDRLQKQVLALQSRKESVLAEVGPEPDEPREGASPAQEVAYINVLTAHLRHRAEHLAAKLVEAQSWQVVAADGLNYAHRLLWALIDRGAAPAELLVINGGRGMEPINVALDQCQVRQPIDSTGRPLGRPQPLPEKQCQHDLCEPEPTLKLIEGQCDYTVSECTVCQQRWTNPVKAVNESTEKLGGGHDAN